MIHGTSPGILQLPGQRGLPLRRRMKLPKHQLPICQAPGSDSVKTRGQIPHFKPQLLPDPKSYLRAHRPLLQLVSSIEAPSSMHVSTPAITRSDEGGVIASCTLQLRSAVSQGERALKRYTRRSKARRAHPPTWCPGALSAEESEEDPAVSSSRDFAEGGSIMTKTLPKKIALSRITCQTTNS